jgi:hypothetical protein
MWKEIRACNLGAIILVAAAIIAGGITDVVPPTMSEPIADFFREAFLLLSGCVAWAARVLADVRLIRRAVPSTREGPSRQMPLR